MTHDLVVRAQNGDRAAADRICRDLTEKVGYMARDFYYPGADHDDIVQWGMLGILYGIRSFKPERAADATGFLLWCARRWMFTGLKTATRQQSKPLNEARRLEQTVTVDGESWTLADELEDARADDPADQVVALDEFRALIAFLKTGLSPYEHDVLAGYLNDKTYRQIELEQTGVLPPSNRAVKTVDNALARVVKKTKHFQQEREAA